MTASISSVEAPAAEWVCGRGGNLHLRGSPELGHPLDKLIQKAAGRREKGADGMEQSSHCSAGGSGQKVDEQVQTPANERQQADGQSGPLKTGAIDHISGSAEGAQRQQRSQNQQRAAR